jgi:hypothetical protein
MSTDDGITPTYSPAKGVVAVIVAGAVFLQSTIADGLSKSDWAGLGGALATAVAVYVLPNLADSPYYGYAKGAAAVLGAVFTGLVLALTNGNLSDVEIWSIVIQAAGAIGVAAVPNTSTLKAVETGPDSFAVPDPDAL